MDERMKLLYDELPKIMNLIAQSTSINSIKAQDKKLRDLFNSCVFPLYKEGILMEVEKNKFNDALSKIHNLIEFGFGKVEKNYIIDKLGQVWAATKRYVDNSKRSAAAA